MARDRVEIKDLAIVGEGPGSAPGTKEIFIDFAVMRGGNPVRGDRIDIRNRGRIVQTVTTDADGRPTGLNPVVCQSNGSHLIEVVHHATGVSAEKNIIPPKPAAAAKPARIEVNKSKNGRSYKVTALVVADNGGPAKNIPVRFDSPSGTVIKVTDANGVAELDNIVATNTLVGRNTRFQKAGSRVDATVVGGANPITDFVILY